MEKINQLSSDWREWIIANIARNCTPESMIEQMVGRDFDPVFAGVAVYQLLANPHAQVEAAAPIRPTSNYIYEPPRFPSAGNVIHTSDRDVRVSLRINKPVVALLDNLLTHEECDELIRLSTIKLKRSTVVDPVTGRDEVIADRTSFGTFFKLKEDDFIARLDRRIAEVMNWPLENGEGIQILNYKIGGEYKTHFDYFPPTDPGSQVHMAKGGQRVSTLVMYLNDVESGGETIMPEIGLAVVPKKGSACYFEYTNSRNQVDPMTLHGGSPVIVGEKWIATKWMRQRSYA